MEYNEKSSTERNFMFNRALQVKMVKNEKNETAESDKIDQLKQKAAVIGVSLEGLVVSVGKVVLAYIAADTIRQVMVTKASK